MVWCDAVVKIVAVVAHCCKELASKEPTCETVVGFKLSEAEMCDSLTLLHALCTNGTVQTQPAIGDTRVKFK